MSTHVRLTGELIRSGSGGAIVDQQGGFWRIEMTAELEQLVGRHVLVDGIAVGERILADYVGLVPDNDA
jgi:hypothetical protein